LEYFNRKKLKMELLRIIIEYDHKRKSLIGRQTSFLKITDLVGNKKNLKIKSKNKINKISVEIINYDDVILNDEDCV